MVSRPWSKSAGAKAPAGDAIDPPVVTGELPARDTAGDAAGWLECLTAPHEQAEERELGSGGGRWGQMGPWPA
ncbi:hypothetical protein, partial [Streptomyces mirabilis]|uniref:hypothetical protein n=1 Tax=Streptomyces mirabilis TaxID=68239 RepID=UPI0036D9AF09